jgi:hypothetical protein|tara:strand:+ start:639 stop:929 length:291 start_codon:yes stop_codon:yes gene_type:complete
MKKLVLVLVMLIGVSSLMSFKVIEDNTIKTEKNLETEFQKGFKDGHCEGWKDVKGKHAYCPYPPYPPHPEYPKVSTSYTDGYNTGFKAGMRAARKN